MTQISSDMGSIRLDIVKKCTQKVRNDPGQVTDDLVMRVVDKPETFVRVEQYQHLSDILQPEE